MYYYVSNDGKVITNLFAQDRYGRSKLQTDYQALRNCFEYVLEAVTEKSSELYGRSVAISYMIGCGMAGGDWKIVYGIIVEVFKDIDVTLYKFE